MMRRRAELGGSMKDLNYYKRNIRIFNTMFENYYRDLRGILLSRLYPDIFIIRDNISTYLSLYKVLKESGCQFYNYLVIRLSPGEVEKYKRILLMPWRYKKSMDPLFMVLERELKYSLYLLRKKIYGDINDFVVDTWSRGDINRMFPMTHFLTPYTELVYEGTYVPKGGCPFCPLFLRNKSCDKRPSDFIKITPTVRIQEIYKTIYNSNVWWRFLTENEKERVVKFMKRRCRLYEKYKWECSSDPLDWRRVPCSMKEEYMRVCRLLENLGNV